ncbi:F-box only protein 9 isoform X2 [Leptinotarsa decemlineata]|uniref:F-box only protein 9 isoform X2 n=1 Tax=Leptinotarsa decemlineata TaxID=7539 RepID=UPI003D30AFE6
MEEYKSEDVNVGEVGGQASSAGSSSYHNNGENVSYDPKNDRGQNEKDVEVDLSTFREKWQSELSSRSSEVKKSSSRSNKNDGLTKVDEGDNIETRARNLYLKGIEMEKLGEIYEALRYYRGAVQLVPDIEFKLYNKSKHKSDDDLVDVEVNEEQAEEDGSDSSNTGDDDDDPIEDGELLPRIQKKFSRKPTLCTPKFERDTTHISQLPVEIILLILKWVISEHLDLRSLENFSSVCRGFYLCARDPELWRLACLRIWKFNCGSSPDNYKSWRTMFIERPRVLFDGCYISKTTYIRNGENVFQDQFYRPWYLVAYYRYLRFFPDGTVLMLTSSDEPVQCINLMKSKIARHPVMTGFYRLKNETVTIVVQKQDNKISPQGMKKMMKLKSEQTHHLEFQIKARRRKHIQLTWSRHSVFTKSKKGDESTCSFELNDNRYPPLIFSRVKSFTATTESPLS